jgi:hypothetical protein
MTDSPLPTLDSLRQSWARRLAEIISGRVDRINSAYYDNPDNVASLIAAGLANVPKLNRERLLSMSKSWLF